MQKCVQATKMHIVRHIAWTTSIYILESPVADSQLYLWPMSIAVALEGKMDDNEDNDDNNND